MTTTTETVTTTNNNKKGVVTMATKNVNTLTVNFSVEGIILRTTELHNLTIQEVLSVLKREVTVNGNIITLDLEDDSDNIYYQDMNIFLALQVTLEKADKHRHDDVLFTDDFETSSHRQALAALEGFRGEKARKVEEIEVTFSKDGQEIESVEILNLKRSTVLSTLEEMGAYGRVVEVKGDKIYIKMEQVNSSEFNKLIEAYMGGLVALDIFANEMLNR